MASDPESMRNSVIWSPSLTALTYFLSEIAASFKDTLELELLEGFHGLSIIPQALVAPRLTLIDR